MEMLGTFTVKMVSIQFHQLLILEENLVYHFGFSSVQDLPQLPMTLFRWYCSNKMYFFSIKTSNFSLKSQFPDMKVYVAFEATATQITGLYIQSGEESKSEPLAASITRGDGNFPIYNSKINKLRHMVLFQYLLWKLLQK